MLALPNSSRQSQHHRLSSQQQQYQTSIQTSTSTYPSSPSIISTPQPQYTTRPSIQNIYTFGTDLPLYDYQSQQPDESSPSSLMQFDHIANSWSESNGQLTPRSATRAHHREASLSSLGSAGPSSPYTANTSNPQVVGDLYHDFPDYQHTTSKPLTPAHTPHQENFLPPHYSSYYNNSNLAYTMGHDGINKLQGDAELMPAPEFNHSGRPSITTVASDSPSTPPSYEEEKQKNVYRTNVPKLNRTMTDVYTDELYNPHIQITSAGHSTNSLQATTLSPQNDVFTQRLQAANNQHLNAAQAQIPLTIPSRGDRSPFRQGSPLAPSRNFGDPNAMFSTAMQIREQQKSENDARALQHHQARTSPEHDTPKTISPKDVDLVYHETEEDANAPLFPQQVQQSPRFRHKQEPSESDDNLSQRSYGSMATTRRESSSAFSASSQQQGNYNFASPAIPSRTQQIPQRYPFVSQARRQPSNMSNVTEDFPATLTSMESSSSEYAPESSENQKPAGALADTGTYTCTYHGCTLRFDTPAKLQRHKREGHRNSAAVIAGGEEGGMTSAAQRNSQAGPHKCERINPSTGKPCNTIFSRPYDLTRHEDTIHNARKQKVHCPYCTEEKTFSRNDALTRHLRVVHPEHADTTRRRRGGGSHD